MRQLWRSLKNTSGWSRIKDNLEGAMEEQIA
jgi:hypothetical protein